MENQHLQAPHLRILQKAIAVEVTTRVHGEHVAQMVIEASNLLFSKDSIQLLENASDELIKYLPMIQVNLESQSLLELLTSATQNAIFPSNGEARKAILGNAVSVNKVKVTDPFSKINKTDLIKDKFLLVGNGKQKNYLLLVN
jgi:tyrosyl-tRNA synthetase